MSALISGYESSDDEAAPVQSTSTVVDPVAFDAEDEDDDDKLEEQARKDAFGISAAPARAAESRESKRMEVMAAPDVLKDVSLVLPRKAGADI
jgi:pre-mRNA-processing factor 17